MSQIVPKGNISNIYPVGYTAKTEARFTDINIAYNETGYTYNDSRLVYGGSDRKQNVFLGSFNKKNIVPSFNI